MRHKTAFSCSQLIQEANLPVVQRAQKLARLEQAVLQLIPVELVAHCKVLNLRNETLVLAASSPAWAARLRFAVPDLIRQLKRRFALEVRSVDLRIQPETSENQSVNKHRLQLSAHSATLVTQTAEAVGHPPLRDALLRLAAKSRRI